MIEINIIYAIAISWWLTSNTYIDKLLTYIKLDYLLCEKCLAFWICFALLIFKTTDPIILLAYPSIASIVSIIVKRETDKF